MYSTTYNKEEKLWYGPDILPLYNPALSLAQALLDSMKVHGPKIAQINDNNGIRMTFDEIRIKTIRAAQNLQALGCERKQVIGIVSRYNQNVTPIAFASIAIGCTASGIDETLERKHTLTMLKITKPAIVFCDVEFYEMLNEFLKELGNTARIFTFGGTVGRSELAESLFEETHKEDQFISERVDAENDIAFIVSTSGSTGNPKGVCWTHAHLLNAISRFESISSDVILTLYTIYEPIAVLMLVKGTLCGAIRVISTADFSPELLLNLVERRKITIVTMVTHQVGLMLKSGRVDEHDISSLKELWFGGGHIPLHMKTELASRFPNAIIRPNYGMTELACCLTFDHPMELENETVGRLTSGMCVKIVDESGNRCGVNLNGELCIKADFKFLGYYDNPEATREVFDDDGFYLTGDIGHFDENGHLFITGRKKEFVRYYDYWMNPTEIEAFLMKSPNIKSVCIVGIPDQMGDLLTAVVVRDNVRNISKKEIFDLVSDNFVDYYKLRGGVHFVDELPTNCRGKVDRVRVAKMAVERLRAVGER